MSKLQQLIMTPGGAQVQALAPPSPVTSTSSPCQIPVTGMPPPVTHSSALPCPCVPPLTPGLSLCALP